MHLTALFIATILVLILQPLPQGAVVILGVAMTAMTQTLPISAAMAGFSDSTVWLIVAAFLFARGFIKTGLGRRIAFVLVRAGSCSPCCAPSPHRWAPSRAPPPRRPVRS
jgi:DASS family divalent anion:Na+ symporter